MKLSNQNSFGKVGIIGNPLSHSLSPVIHNYWLNLYNINFSYIALETERNEIDTIIKKIKDEEYIGFNVTIPFKEEIIPHLDSIDEDSISNWLISSSG